MRYAVLFLLLIFFSHVAWACMCAWEDAETAMKGSYFIGLALVEKIRPIEASEIEKYDPDKTIPLPVTNVAHLKTIQAYKGTVGETIIAKIIHGGSCGEFLLKQGHISEVVIENRDGVGFVIPSNCSYGGIWEEVRKNASEPAKEYNDLKKSCESKGGKFILDENFIDCRYPSADGGKSCSDNKDCEGKCFGELTSEEKSARWPVPIKRNGQCSPWKNPAGCHYVVAKGIISSSSRQCMDWE